jgi:hypothetical protein
MAKIAQNDERDKFSRTGLLVGTRQSRYIGLYLLLLRLYLHTSLGEVDERRLQLRVQLVYALLSMI